MTEPGDDSATTAPNSVELLELGIELARTAGELVRDGRESGLGVIGRKSTPTDLVTAMDKASETLIVDGILAARPHDGVLGEEGGERSGTSGVRWILDPIDGTVNYVYGIPQYAISIAAEYHGVIVAGVVRNPATGEEWTATRGGGAWRDGVRLTGPNASTVDQALVGTGFAYSAQIRARQARVVSALMGEVRDIRRFGAAALDLCAVAEGRLDAYFEHGLNAWDRAAGGLIAGEAGVVVTGLRGHPASEVMTLAAPESLHQALHDRLVELDADRVASA